MAKKLELHLVGPKDGAPSFDDIMTLFKRLTGREPTPDEFKEAKEAWDK